MQLRQNQGCGPQITFTSDFHELVQGDLIPGPCLLRYDPLRLVSLEKAAIREHRIRAYVRFHPVGVVWQATLELPAGLPLADLADISGRGFMLSATFEIPQGCDELEVWFSCTHADGRTEWDSDFGKNHWLRFGLADFTIQRAVVVAAKERGAPQDTLDFECTTPAKIDAVALQWRLPSNPADTGQNAPLACTSASATGKTWTSPAGGIPVPKGATVAFEILYAVGGRSYKDNNQGRWYIAD